jgi:hypothetical protein
MALSTKFTPNCTVCKKPMALVDGKAIYYLDKSKHKDKYYICTLDNVEIRCFPGSLKPMGRPADGTLKEERRWVGVKIDTMIKAKMRRDSVSEQVAQEAAWKWVSKIVGKPVERVEDLNVPEMGDIIPELRKIG